jgi:hypothetical protein
MPVMTNAKGGKTVLHFTATDNVVVVGNSAVSNVALADETVRSATITQIVWGTGAAADRWTIKRGANTVAILGGTGKLDLVESSMPISLFTTGTVVAELTGTGFIMIELHKTSNVANSQYSSG